MLIFAPFCPISPIFGKKLQNHAISQLFCAHFHTKMEKSIRPDPHPRNDFHDDRHDFARKSHISLFFCKFCRFAALSMKWDPTPDPRFLIFLQIGLSWPTKTNFIGPRGPHPEIKFSPTLCKRCFNADPRPTIFKIGLSFFLAAIKSLQILQDFLPIPKNFAGHPKILREGPNLRPLFIFLVTYLTYWPQNVGLTPDPGHTIFRKSDLGPSFKTIFNFRVTLDPGPTFHCRVCKMKVEFQVNSLFLPLNL
jgi:hypothetical protein